MSEEPLHSLTFFPPTFRGNAEMFSQMSRDSSGRYLSVLTIYSRKSHPTPDILSDWYNVIK